MIIDTDTFNEIDDQFTLVYALSSPENINLLGITAAPFFNAKSSSPKDGMERSYAEIKKILTITQRTDIPVFAGATEFMTDYPQVIDSEAVEFIIKRAKEVYATREKLHICAIAAATNIASALLKAPEIADMIKITWLGGHHYEHERKDEFNLRQDVLSVQIMLQSGCEFTQLPCLGVVEFLRVNGEEINQAFSNNDKLSSYLKTIFADYLVFKGLSNKVLWDIATVAMYNVSEAFISIEIPTPELTKTMDWILTNNSSKITLVEKIDKTLIFNDMFNRINNMIKKRNQ